MKLMYSPFLLQVLRDSLYRQLGQLTGLQRLHLGSGSGEAVRLPLVTLYTSPSHNFHPSLLLVPLPPPCR